MVLCEQSSGLEKIWRPPFDPNFKSLVTQRASLHNAAEYCRIQVAEMLLGAYADLHAVDVDGETPLNVAAWSGCLGVIRLLIDRSVDVNQVNREGRTAFFDAAMENNVEAAVLLLDAGCNKQHLSYNMDSPLNEAAQRGLFMMAKMLIEGGDVDVNHRTAKGESPLISAVRCGHARAARVLLEFGARVDLEDGRGMNSLASAVANGMHDIARLILAARAYKDVSAKFHDMEELTPLLIGVGNNDSRESAICCFTLVML